MLVPPISCQGCQDSLNLPMLEEELHKTNLIDSDKIPQIIDKYSEHPIVKEKSAYHKLHVIDECFSGRTVEEILSSLENEAAKNKDDWLSAAITSLKKASPTSLKLCLRSIREGRFQEISQCLAREYRMVCHVMHGKISTDFFEGCRAILVDKDRNPKWEPSRLDQVTDDVLDCYFSRMNDEDWEDLKLPVRSKSMDHYFSITKYEDREDLKSHPIVVAKL